VHSGANYWFSPKNVTDNVSTPNAVANQIIADIEIVANIDLIEANNNAIIAKRSGGNNISFSVVVDFLGRLAFVFTQNGSTTITAISSASITTANKWIKVTRQSSSGDVKFFTSADGVTYTQLGTTQSTTAGNMFNSTASLIVGNNSVGGGDGYGGKIYRLTLSNSIGGAPVVDFNPSQYNAANSQTQWTSTTGEVWSINTGTATSGYKGVLVDRTIVQSDGVDDTMQSGTITTRTNFTRYFAFNTIVAGGTQYFIDGDISNRHTIYKTSAFLIFYNAGAGAAEISISNTVGLKLITGDYNTTSSKLRTNAGADTNGSVGSGVSSKVTLFGAGAGGLNSNYVFTSLIDAIAVNNNTIKTAVYNQIKTLNNNAF
jgi:stage V sporulation protein SpoVS